MKSSRPGRKKHSAAEEKFKVKQKLSPGVLSSAPPRRKPRAGQFVTWGLNIC